MQAIIHRGTHCPAIDTASNIFPLCYHPLVIYNWCQSLKPADDMLSTQATTGLMATLAASLEAADAPDRAAAVFIERLAEALRSATLSRNPKRPETIRPDDEWQRIFPPDGAWRDDRLLAGLQELRLACRWFRAESFYSGPEHRHFSEAVWGAPIAGGPDAPFDSGGAYIALLIVIAPRVTYPLHAHRIEEAYFKLSGSGDWPHDGEHWQHLPPATVFHNTSWQPHSMRSHDEPLLAMGLYLPPFGWEGGLV